ncbi:MULTISPECIES: SDR family NAD(P)-dependent oxidoreductase [unclassified Nocardioides]|uniref:SDR family NAD(P)-dependent oxidoreductase n=1 Tax=unclassified Nocardioides TaxID=2615069 RepID=UPI0006F2C4D1|nr:MULTISPECIES: SDR family oxidoreductase [unclassified Nocardioides]KRA30060.1 oxidoreductase [Nocardioides sp. Root614]KRA86980.1 oxidoreductase [Nocardioides sp. Root682]
MSLTIVTGGTRGIGAAIAARLAGEGHDLVLGYRSDEESAQATAEVVTALGVRCVTVRADLTTDAGIDELFARAAELGRLTGVVNNAGATYRFAPLDETPTEEIRRTIDLNLTGPILVARAAVAVLDRGGVVVNITSGAATIGSPGEYVHYAAAKAGLDAATRGLGLEVADRGIRVVAIAPGLIATDLHATTGDPERVERMAPQIPLGRAGQPEEIANAVAWLMSEQAAYVTATTLRVAGGR